MWSVGCIMAEMVAKEALFKGKTEVDQLDKVSFCFIWSYLLLVSVIYSDFMHTVEFLQIFKTLGTPNETVWPGFSKMPGAKAKFVKQP